MLSTDVYTETIVIGTYTGGEVIHSIPTANEKGTIVEAMIAIDSSAVTTPTGSCQLAYYADPVNMPTLFDLLQWASEGGGATTFANNFGPIGTSWIWMTRWINGTTNRRAFGGGGLLKLWLNSPGGSANDVVISVIVLRER